MLFPITVVFVIVQLFSLISCDYEDVDSYPELKFIDIDRSNYIDPHDMLNYDRQKIKTTTKERIELKTYHDGSTALPPSQKPSYPNLDNIQETEFPPEVESPEKTIQFNPEDQDSSCSKNTTSLIELPFLGRFVKTLTATLQIKDKLIEDNDILYIPLLAVVNKRTQFILSEITKEGEEIQLKNLADLDEILTNLLILNEEKQDSSYPFPILSIFSRDLLNPKDLVVTMFICSLWFVLWLTFKGYSNAYILSRSLLPFFIVSWFWHWNYLHQKSSAQRHSDLSKNTDVPEACRPDQLTAWRSISLYFSKTLLRNPDPCEEYHRVVMTDPSYEVNPFVALIDMLVNGIFQPLGYIGTKIGSFFDGVLSSTGWMYKIPVFTAVLLIICMVLLMCFSYEIRIPFVKFGPSVFLPSSPQQPIAQQPIAQQPIAQQPIAQQPIAGPQNVQGVSQIGSLANNLMMDHPALNVSISGATQQYVYQEVTIKRTYSHVQPVEVRQQDSVEDCPEDPTIPFGAIEELVGSALPIWTANDTNTEKVVQTVESVPVDSAEKYEKELQLDDSAASTEEICKGIEF